MSEENTTEIASSPPEPTVAAVGGLSVAESLPVEKPFRVETEGAEGAAPPITNISMQAEDPEDAQRAAAARERVEERAPIRSQTELEMEAGRRRVAEIAGREALLAAKRNSEASEGDGVSAASRANKDL